MIVPAQALDALHVGMSVIPAAASKRPLVSWRQWQHRCPDESRLRAWARMKRPPLWGIVTGAVSGVVVLDFDGDDGRTTLDRLRLSPQRMTPRGGYHVTLAHPGVPIPTLTTQDAELGAGWPGMDVRGDGGFCVIVGHTLRGDYVELCDPLPHPWEAAPAELRAVLVRRGVPGIRRDGPAARAAASSAAGDDDPLLEIPPAVYVAELGGIPVDRTGKALCPFHDDRDTPSLHVYPTGAQGWFCFGCGRGGGIYQFAAHTWGYPADPLRGAAFLQTRDRLLDWAVRLYEGRTT